MLRTGRDERRRFSLVAPRKKLDKAKKKKLVKPAGIDIELLYRNQNLFYCRSTSVQ